MAISTSPLRSGTESGVAGQTRVAGGADRAAALTGGSAGRVRVAVVDLQGRELATLAEGDHGPGWHFATWRGRAGERRASAGIYFIRYQVAGRTFMRKFALMR